MRKLSLFEIEQLSKITQPVIKGLGIRTPQACVLHGGKGCVSSVYCFARMPCGTWHREGLRNIYGRRKGRRRRRKEGINSVLSDTKVSNLSIIAHCLWKVQQAER